MKPRLFLVVLLFLALASPSYGDSVSHFVFNGNVGDIGKSDTFTRGPFQLILSGYSAPMSPTDMWEKALGPSETGVGVTIGSDREINGPEFLQISLVQPFTKVVSDVTVFMNSIQPGESYDVWGSRTAGQLGVLLAANQTKSSFDIPNLGAFDYISVSAAEGNVILEDVDINAPEPSSLLLLLVGLATAIGLLKLYRR